MASFLAYHVRLQVPKATKKLIFTKDIILVNMYIIMYISNVQSKQKLNKSDNFLRPKQGVIQVKFHTMINGSIGKIKS